MTQNYHFRSLKQLECVGVNFLSFMGENIQKYDNFLVFQFVRLTKYGFLEISPKVNALELKVVVSANINMHIAVILS